MDRRSVNFKTYVIKRLAFSIPTIFALIVNFFVIHLAPGDPVCMFIGTSDVRVPRKDEIHV